jgi:heme/copper-type cytochrome/quinol oxidase subunit 2
VVTPRGAAESPRLSARDAAKFTAAVALFAIFVDAAIGHGLTWENDPYWTYWVTKTFLIATIFGLGTAWFGVGVGRGAVITLVHTLVLTIYYWTLAPIGLPSSPEWLDLEHTWLTGLPIHFGVIYLGYLLALWIWRRRRPDDETSSAYEGVVALAAALAIVVVAGGAAALAIGDFPGVTWFLTRLLVTVPFVLLWWSIAGRDPRAAITGALVLGFVWATYSEFVGPSGLPDTPLRLFDQAPPPATAYWSDYRDLWLISLPIYLAVMAVILFVASRVLARRRALTPPTLANARVPVAMLVLTIAVLALFIPAIKSGGTDIDLAASGDARVEVGEYYEGPLESASASLDVVAEDHNAGVTPLEPHDEVMLKASVTHPNGTTYEIAADRPIISDPLGRHTTWWGVGVDVWHHGKSGIGSDKLPNLYSEVALFALGSIQVDGKSIAVGVPMHVMTAENGLPGKVELDVGDEEAPIPGIPNGHLRVVWATVQGGANEDAHWRRYVLGDLVLVLLLAFGLGGNLRPRRPV